MGGIVTLLRRTVAEWQEDECLEMGAGMAYYALFSLFPLILVVLSIFGFFLGPDSDVRAQILDLAAQGLPPAAFAIVEDTLNGLADSSRGASIIGFATLLLTASGFFGALDRAFDKIWATGEEQPPANNGVAGAAMAFVGKKLVAFGLVVACAAIVLLSQLATLAIGVLIELTEQVTGLIDFIALDSALLLRTAQFGVSLVLLWLVLMLLFRFLPSTRVTFGDVWLGALVTATLFMILQRLVSGSVITLGANFQSYGVVGGVMVLMLWIFLTSQILFIGAELAYAYALTFGSRRNQVAATEAADAAAQPVTAPPVPTTTTGPGIQRRAEHEAASEAPPTAIAAAAGLIAGAAGTVAFTVAVVVMAVVRSVQSLRRTA